MHGWRVDGYDVLPDALENARYLAGRYGVGVNGIERDLRKTPDIGVERYDLVCMFRFWDEAVYAAAVRALRHGGLLVVEAFAEGDRKRVAKLATVEELVKQAAGLTVLIAREAARNGRRFAQLIARRD
jgi:SAM-dependent methyltransferase